MPFGRYRTYAPVATIAGQAFRPGYVHQEFLYSGQETFHTVNPGEVGRLDLVSYAEYGDPGLWWVIALHNSLKNPLTEVEAGMVLKIPVETTVVTQMVRAHWRQEAPNAD